jgi:hypothetical protein
VDDVRVIEFAHYDITNIHPSALAFMAVMAVLAFLPRRSAPTFALLSVCVFMHMDQRLVVGGFDFSMLRLITLAVLLRVLIRGEYRGFQFGRLDRLFVAWVLSAGFIYLIRVGSKGVVESLGYTLDALGSYFAMRLLVRTPQQVLTIWKQLAWIVVILSPFMVYEWATRQNPFGILTYDGFEIAVVRNGKVRAAGPLSHPILTGTFGAVLIPVFVGIFRGSKKHRLLMGTACIAATIVTFSSGSSGPLMAWAIGFFGWGMWRFRRHMRTILWGLFALGVVIHFVREKPIWHLILRLSAITGGTGYHRYELIDAFVNRFSEWALLGTDSTAHWGWGLQDTTNQYVVEGVNGGLLTLIIFILVLRTSFVQLKRARIVFERFEGPKSIWAQLAWGCSVSLMVHCVSFVSVSYFGQILQFFFFFVGTVPAMAGYRRPKRAKVAVRESPMRAMSPHAEAAAG